MNNRIILNALRFQLACIESEAESLYRDQHVLHRMIKVQMLPSDSKKKSLNRISHLNRRKAKIVATIKEIKHA